MNLYSKKTISLNKTIDTGESMKSILDLIVNNYFMFEYYFLLAMISIGILGNAISLFIFISPNLNKKTNTGFLFSILCASNIVYILVEFSAIVFKANLPRMIFPYIQITMPDIILWMQVLISFDRFVIVFYHSKNIMTKKVFSTINYFFLMFYLNHFLLI